MHRWLKAPKIVTDVSLGIEWNASLMGTWPDTLQMGSGGAVDLLHWSPCRSHGLPY